jgi:AcrR family transcriptional regulator
MRAGVALVSERGTANIRVSEITEAADVSRQLLYQHFGSREALLLEAALDLANRELLPHIAQGLESTAETSPLLAVVQHFARYRPFYRAMLTSSCAYKLTTALNDLLGPFNQQMVDLIAGSGLEPQVTDDLTMFVTGGWAAVINRWLIEGADPLDAEAFSHRLMEIFIVIAGAATGLVPVWAPASSPGNSLP